MDTSRLELFADGIFAIAATLLIIDVSVDARGGELGAALVHSWPAYAAYGVSFVTIGIWWVNHHACMALIDRADRAFLFANIALLACIAFLPFPTALVAEHFRDDGVRAAAIAYGLTMTAGAVCFLLFWFYAAAGRRLIAETADQRAVDGISRSVLPGVPINVAATLVPFGTRTWRSCSSRRSRSSTWSGARCSAAARSRSPTSRFNAPSTPSESSSLEVDEPRKRREHGLGPCSPTTSRQAAEGGTPGFP